MMAPLRVLDHRLREIADDVCVADREGHSDQTSPRDAVQ